MAKLVLSMNSVEQGEYELNKERLAIGRKPNSDIHIDNLAVSGKHALIITILDDSFLEDLGSTNGTYVNNKLIKKHALKNNDVISIGKHELKYINEHASDDDDDFEKTVIIKPNSASAAVAAARAAEKAVMATNKSNINNDFPKKSKLPLGSLTILNGPISGKELELTKALITLGKVGYQVAVISRKPQGYYLTHIESGKKNKSYPIVNGVAIGVKSYLLKNYDIIELAGIKMEFTLNS